MTAAEALRLARARIETPERWVQGTMVAFRLEDGGYDVGVWKDIFDPSACLCADAALLSIFRNTGHVRGAGLALSLAARSHGFETASKYNDAPGRTHAEILALFDEAIRLAECMAEVPS